MLRNLIPQTDLKVIAGWTVWVYMYSGKQEKRKSERKKNEGKKRIVSIK